MNKNLKLANDPAGLNASEVQLPENAAVALANMLQALSKLPAVVLELADLFTAKGQELSLVGGPVRDAMCGREPHDWDLATSARPDETEQILKDWAGNVWTMGKEFGTIGAHKAGLTVEVTTYRSDKYQKNSRKPAVKFGDTLEGDLTRRDFTVNAMALRLPDLTLVDPHQGIADLVAGQLRTPVSPEQSFDDDPLRMMRAARFASQLDLDVTMPVMAAMENMASRIEIVSPERVRSELEALMVGKNPRKGLELMVYTELAAIVLPEVANLRATVDEHGRHKDVYEHTLTVVDQAIALETGPEGEVPRPDFILRFAALMHDVGKPATRRFEKDGTVSFHHHEIVGAKLTRKRMHALHFDKQTIKDVTQLVALHLRFHGYGEQAWSDSAVRRYVADAGPMLTRLHRLTRADCTTRNRRRAARLEHAYDDLEKRIAQLAEKEELSRIRPELDGEEIMQILQLKPGPQVGKAYKYLLNLRLEEGEIGKEAARERLLEWWESESA